MLEVFALTIKDNLENFREEKCLAFTYIFAHFFLSDVLCFLFTNFFEPFFEGKPAGDRYF